MRTLETKTKKMNVNYANRTIHSFFPGAFRHHSCVSLGNFPTPVELLSQNQKSNTEIWVKREDISSQVYGGNKIRTLEWLFGKAIDTGCDEICSTGAYGSNHAVATVLHASRAGLNSSVMLHPQPFSETAGINFEISLAKSDEVNLIPHWSVLPVIWLRKQLRDKRQNKKSYIMMPGGATPLGALGYVSAALELLIQVDRGDMPSPERIVLSVGSSCTTAGLLLGTEIAARLDCRRWNKALPDIVAVRVTPWPVTAHRRIILLAYRTSRYLFRLTGDPRVLVSRNELSKRLKIDTSQLGSGYGHPTKSGLNAIKNYSDLTLDTTYSAKAAASIFKNRKKWSGCTLFWATKSSVPLPVIDKPLLKGNTFSNCY